MKTTSTPDDLDLPLVANQAPKVDDIMHGDGEAARMLASLAFATENDRDLFRRSYPMLHRCLLFHALDARDATHWYTAYVVVALMAFFIFTFPPAERVVIYISDAQYFIEWCCARYYLSSSEHFFSRAAVLLKYQKPDERFVWASIFASLATVAIEKLVWFLTNGLGGEHTIDELEYWLEIFASVTFLWRRKLFAYVLYQLP